jgi:protein phosphatase
MGTTMTCLLMKDKQYAWANIGDSRIYKITENTIQQITNDHTYIQDYIQKKGSIPADLAKQYSHYILKVIDGQKQAPDLFPVSSNCETLQNGDVLLLCSDGLILDSLHTNTNLLKNYVIGSDTLEQAAKQLYDYAFHSGSSDNITIVLVEYGQLKRKKLNLRKHGESNKTAEWTRKGLIQWVKSLFV